jgi:hypothetical protein
MGIGNCLITKRRKRFVAVPGYSYLRGTNERIVMPEMNSSERSRMRKGKLDERHSVVDSR